MKSLRVASRGFSLIEVLFAMLIIAIGILGVAGLQMLSLQRNSSALHRTYASQFAYDIVDRIRANRTADYTIAMGDAIPGVQDCEGATCTPAQLAQYDLNGWMTDLAAALPAGDASIALAGTVYTVTVQWQDDRGGGAPTSIQFSADIRP